MNTLVLSDETAIAPSDVIMNGETFTEYDLDLQSHDVILRLNETDNPEEVDGFITNLNAIEKISARVKAKTIFAYSQWYKRINPEGNFFDWYIEHRGGDKLTLQKQQAVGDLLLSEDVPANVKELPIKELVSVARAKQGGYDMSECWDEIAHAGSESEVNAIVHKVKNTPERAGTLSLSVQPDGTITAYQNGTMVSVGWLNYADRDDESMPEEKRKVLQTAISRVVNNSRMKVK